MENEISVKLKLTFDEEKLQEIKTLFMGGRYDGYNDRDFLNHVIGFYIEEIEDKYKELLNIQGDDALEICLTVN